MITRANYIRQCLDETARIAGLNWDAEVAAWRASVEAILDPWEAEMAAWEALPEDERAAPPPKPATPPHPVHASRVEAQQAAMQSDPINHGAAWDANPAFDAIRASQSAETSGRATRRQALLDLLASWDTFDNTQKAAAMRNVFPHLVRHLLRMDGTNA